MRNNICFNMGNGCSDHIGGRSRNPTPISCLTLPAKNSYFYESSHHALDNNDPETPKQTTIYGTVSRLKTENNKNRFVLVLKTIDVKPALGQKPPLIVPTISDTNTRLETGETIKHTIDNNKQTLNVPKLIEKKMLLEVKNDDNLKRANTPMFGNNDIVEAKSTKMNDNMEEIKQTEATPKNGKDNTFDSFASKIFFVTPIDDDAFGRLSTVNVLRVLGSKRVIKKMPQNKAKKYNKPIFLGSPFMTELSRIDATPNNTSWSKLSIKSPFSPLSPVEKIPQRTQLSQNFLCSPVNKRRDSSVY